MEQYLIGLLPTLKLEEQYLIGLLLAIGLAPFLHEGSHWFVTWLGRGNPKFRCKLIFPNSVIQQDLESLDSEIIRFSGFAPFLWIPVGVVTFLLFFNEPSPYNLFVAMVPFSVLLMCTEADALAFREPEKYREKALNGEFDRNPLFLPNWILPGWLPRF